MREVALARSAMRANRATQVRLLQAAVAERLVLAFRATTMPLLAMLFGLLPQAAPISMNSALKLALGDRSG
jgi:hypothetical protein